LVFYKKFIKTVVYPEAIEGLTLSEVEGLP